jgi:aromatic ring hydroxylase-like protein/FAD binding domain-containing protein
MTRQAASYRKGRVLLAGDAAHVHYPVVQLIDAEHVGSWELPVAGAVPAPTPMLIRPDGYVAWVGDGADLKLHDALTTWFSENRFEREVQQRDHDSQMRVPGGPARTVGMYSSSCSRPSKVRLFRSSRETSG